MPTSDYLLDAAHEHLPHIVLLYKACESKNPVMLFDLQEQRIYAYPMIEFSRTLSQRSQQSLKMQYDAAMRDNQMVIFVRDNEQKRFVSFSMDVE